MRACVRAYVCDGGVSVCVCVCDGGVSVYACQCVCWKCQSMLTVSMCVCLWGWGVGVHVCLCKLHTLQFSFPKDLCSRVCVDWSPFSTHPYLIDPHPIPPPPPQI